MSARQETSTQILDIAQQLVQERSFNAISYADISSQLGIKNASIHYHFPTKADLGVALVRRYRLGLHHTLAQIPLGDLTTAQALEQYLQSFRQVIRPDGRICMCVVLAAEFQTLPEAVQREVQAFFDVHSEWLGEVLAGGTSANGTNAEGGDAGESAAQAAAAQVLATFYGAMLLARVSGGWERFEALGRQAIHTAVGSQHSAS